MREFKFEDISGQTFGHLLVLEHIPDRKDCAGFRFYRCRCDCGKIIEVRKDNLITGHSTKCKNCAYKGRKTRKVKKYEWMDRES